MKKEQSVLAPSKGERLTQAKLGWKTNNIIFVVCKKSWLCKYEIKNLLLFWFIV